ncbi:MAG: 4Fe-4S dicluster domain-containing protein [Chthonomonadales bacterium]
MARLAMLIDLTRCIGCDACTVACKQENGTPADVFFARVLNVEAGTFPNVKRVYIPVLCNHCENPACLKACPNKAIFRRPDGIVLIDQDRCRGTGACVSACPYGNIVLRATDEWYLPEDRAYERDFVRPRLKQNVARKCTFCAQRVDQGLEPACVVACPTTARIFGDLEDPSSKISRYVAEQRERTGRDPFKLLPECATEPANLYLGTMAAQETAGQGVVPTQEPREPSEWMAAGPPEREGRHPAGTRNPAGAVHFVARMLGLAGAALLLVLASRSAAQQQSPRQPNPPETPAEVWANSSCAGCHGPTGMGAFGPPLAGTRLSLDQVKLTVRRGKGMMPALPPSDTSDAEIAQIYDYLRHTKLDPSQIPASYRVATLLSVRNVGIGFSLVTLVALLLSLKVLWYWLDCAGVRQLKPYVGRLGYGKALAIVLRALVVDGLLVGSLYKKDKFRWVMHGLLIYGFGGLMLADMLMQAANPLRNPLPLTHPLKLLPNLAGLAVFAGIVYVRYRYARDEYIDNGLTLGRDYLFINQLALVILTGFLVETLRYSGANLWVMPLYVVHLLLVAILLVSAPFTRFQHVFVVPALVAVTRLTEAIVARGVDLQFAYEPSPGRHHKSQRIAEGVLKQIDPAFAGKIRIRYYP